MKSGVTPVHITIVVLPLVISYPNKKYIGVANATTIKPIINDTMIAILTLENFLRLIFDPK